MSRVWAIAPSIRPQGGTLPIWKAAGYKVAVLRQGDPFPEADITVPTETYRGWAKSINFLARFVMNIDPEAEWLCVSNDDTLPDQNHTPEEIASQLTEHFGGTFGVMQPTGDFALWPGSNILGFAGSPWMGRSWCERAYGGRGPIYDGFRHNWSDQELMEVAVKLGVFWQRPDLLHKHLHVGRDGGQWKWESWQKPLNDPGLWQVEKARFEQRRRDGFPGHEPLVTESISFGALA